MKPGDMVVLIQDPWDQSTAWIAGLRKNAIGTITSPTDGISDFGSAYRWIVNFPGFTLAKCLEEELRLIPPNEPCEAGWDWRDFRVPTDTFAKFKKEEEV